jgi:hypothetical protein
MCATSVPLWAAHCLARSYVIDTHLELADSHATAIVNTSDFPQ